MSGRGREPCRYFLQGTCKFGDRCRNYHPKGRVDSRGDGRSKYQPSRNDSDPSYRAGSNRFALFSDWEGDGESRGRGGGGNRGQHQQNYGGRGYRQDNYQDKYHYTSPSYQASQQERRNAGGGSDGWRGGGGNKGGWKESGSGWKGGGGGGGGGWKESGSSGWRRDSNDDTHSGGWRGGDRRDSRSSISTSEAPTTADIVLAVRKDMEESLAMWPLTCYGYSSHVHLPDLVDVSPEELRLEAYKATSSPSPDTYLRSLEATIRQQTSLRTKYASITQDQLETLTSGMSSDQGSGLFGSLSSASTTGPSSATPLGLFGPTTTGSVGSSSMNVPSSAGLFGAASSAASQDKPVSSLFPSAHQSSASSSLFAPPPTTPTSSGLSLFPPSAPSNPASVSTSSSTGTTSTTGTTTSTLSQEDLEAFKADKFVLGKIPEVAPIPELC